MTNNDAADQEEAVTFAEEDEDLQAQLRDNHSEDAGYVRVDTTDLVGQAAAAALISQTQDATVEDPAGATEVRGAMGTPMSITAHTTINNNAASTPRAATAGGGAPTLQGEALLPAREALQHRQWQRRKTARSVRLSTDVGRL